VRERGWTLAGELKPGDQLASLDGPWLAVESVLDSGLLTTVYNFRVSDYHTDFVGTDQWSFAVWAHNANCEIEVVAGKYVLRDSDTRMVMAEGTELAIERKIAAEGHNLTRIHASQDRVLATLPSERVAVMVEVAKPSQQGKRVLVDAYTNPGDHAPAGSSVREPGSTRPYDPRKSVLPENHVELFEQSIPLKNVKGVAVRWAVEDVGGELVYHRFEPHLPNVYHWNGSTAGVLQNGTPRGLQKPPPYRSIQVALGING